MSKSKKREIAALFFDRMSAEWRAEQDRCLREIERYQAADQSYPEEGVRLLELARDAQRLFEKQESREKRRLLDFVVSNCTWKCGELVANLRQSFDLLAEMTSIAANAAAGNKPDLAKTEIWPRAGLTFACEYKRLDRQTASHVTIGAEGLFRPLSNRALRADCVR